MGEAVAVSASDDGSIIRRAASEWSLVRQGDKAHEGELLVGLPGAKIDSANGAIGLRFLADLDHRSPFPVKESAVRLEAPSGEDIRVTLDRGRIDLTNQKGSGAASARVTVRKSSWEIVLEEPGARLALELYGVWPKGVPFHMEPGPKEEPTASLIFLVLQGRVVVKHEGHEHALQAPPGPALMEWDSVSGQDETPERLAKLPVWANDSDSAEAKTKQETIERFRKAALSGTIETALQTFINSDNEGDRETGHICHVAWTGSATWARPCGKPNTRMCGTRECSPCATGSGGAGTGSDSVSPTR